MILAGVATLQEIETFWSIDDLADANEALDVQQEQMDLAAENSRRQAPRGRS